MSGGLKSIFFILLFLSGLFLKVEESFAANENPYWEIQSIDTMKLSRDLAREKRNDFSFDATISQLLENISKIGATHVAIATPYDSEFLGYLKRWVKIAREKKLKVWFRGNFSGWEGWFGYEPINRDKHLQMLKEFILKNKELFEDGDIFTPCTECENGGPGDPRVKGDIEEFRNFLIEEYEVALNAFKVIGKDVKPNFFSMNFDVALLIMDKKTTQKLGGIVVIDHYVRNPEILARDVSIISEKSGGKVVIGEMGVPIFNIHGEISEDSQADWLLEAFKYLSKQENLIGLNYWTATNGSTSIWHPDNNPKPAVSVIEGFFKPVKFEGKILNQFGFPVEGVKVSADSKVSKTTKEGFFSINLSPTFEEIVVEKEGYKRKKISPEELYLNSNIILERKNPSLIYKFFVEIFLKLKNIFG